MVSLRVISGVTFYRSRHKHLGSEKQSVTPFPRIPDILIEVSLGYLEPHAHSHLVNYGQGMGHKEADIQSGWCPTMRGWTK